MAFPRQARGKRGAGRIFLAASASRSRFATGRRIWRFSITGAIRETPVLISSPGASYPSMYRSQIWTMRQYTGMATSEETNDRFKFLLESGQTGLSLAFDLPTQLGLDSDDPWPAMMWASWEWLWTPRMIWDGSLRTSLWTR